MHIQPAMPSVSIYHSMGIVIRLPKVQMQPTPDALPHIRGCDQAESMHDNAIDQAHKFEFQVKPLVQDGTGQCACISRYTNWFMWRGLSHIPLENMKSS
jgi:hypothetical protein